MNKKLLSGILLWFFWLSFSEGAILIVSNQPVGEEQYSSVQSAIEQALPYDTILVKASHINYGNALLEKPLTLISESAFYSDPSLPSSKLTRVLFTSNPFRRTSSSGSRIIGFEFPYFAGQRANIITVANPRVSIDNIHLEQNWIWFVDIVGNARNWTFTNNIIRGRVSGNSGNEQSTAKLTQIHFYNNILNSIRGFMQPGLHLHNNVILGRLQDISGAKVLSNIFTRKDYILDNVSSTHFQNNLAMGTLLASEDCYDRTDVFEALHHCSGKANTGSNNKVGGDPGFLYWPTRDIMGGAVFALSSSSSARQGRNKDNQAGIFGGKYPFPPRFALKPEIEDPFPSFATSIY